MRFRHHDVPTSHIALVAVVLMVLPVAGCDQPPTVEGHHTPTADVIGWPCFSPDDWEVAEAFAPVLYQASAGVADRIAAFGYDGDMLAGNNWDNLNYFPKVRYGLLRTRRDHLSLLHYVWRLSSS